MQRPHWFRAQLAAPTLIGLAGIGKAVREHDLARLERRPDELFHMLSAGGEHQRQLSLRVQAQGSRIEQQLAYALADGGAAGLTRGHHFVARGAQRGRQLLHLRALAATVKSLESDEYPAHRWPWSYDKLPIF